MIGDGDPNCPLCLGRGVVDVEDGEMVEGEGFNYLRGPSVRVCECVRKRDLLKNVNRGWKNLLRAGKLSSPSPLLGLTDTSVWVTADRNLFRAHVRHVALRQGPLWNFHVKSDMDLMTAWLGSVALKRKEIFDADVAREAASESLKFHALVDLVLPPELLILQLGVKAARNEAMPEVFQEAILARDYEGKPTWVWDQPNNQFAPGHFCYSMGAHDALDSFDRLKLDGEVVMNRKTSSPKRRRKTPLPGGIPSLSGAMGSQVGGTQTVKLKPKKRK